MVGVDQRPAVDHPIAQEPPAPHQRDQPQQHPDPFHPLPPRTGPRLHRQRHHRKCHQRQSRLLHIQKHAHQHPQRQDVSCAGPEAHDPRPLPSGGCEQRYQQRIIVDHPTHIGKHRREGRQPRSPEPNRRPMGKGGSRRGPRAKQSYHTEQYGEQPHRPHRAGDREAVLHPRFLVPVANGVIRPI